MTIAFLIVAVIFGVGLTYTAEVITTAVGASPIPQIYPIAAAFIISLLFLLSFIRKHNEDYKDIEQGSARWGKKKDIKKYINEDFNQNLLLSQTERLSVDDRQTKLNCHVLVYGGSGAGKTYRYVIPNLLTRNASYAVIDPSNDVMHNTGKLFEESGYKIKYFDTVNIKNSMHFNPFEYFEDIKDIRRFITTFMNNTKGTEQAAKAQSGDPFWDKAETLWLMSVSAYLMEACDKKDRSIPNIVAILNLCSVREDDEDYKSLVDIMFAQWEEEHQDSFACKQYRKYQLAAGKTAKSILISLGIRLQDFDIPEINEMFSDDELELDKMGLEKTILYIAIDDGDSTYNYLSAMLVSTMWQINKRIADKQPHGRLPIRIRSIIDEVGNVGVFTNLNKETAVQRRRNMFIELLFQSRAQNEKNYGKEGAAIIEDCCDTVLFLGGKGEATTKYVSENLLGKATIHYENASVSKNSNGIGYNSLSAGEQTSRRELLDQTEVALLGTDECIVSIRSLPPFRSEKIRTWELKDYDKLGNDNENRIYKYTRPLSLDEKVKKQMCKITSVYDFTNEILED